MVTLAELAREQANNKDNPWIPPQSGGSGEGPDTPSPPLAPQVDPNAPIATTSAPATPAASEADKTVVSAPTINRTGSSPGMLVTPETKVVGQPEGKLQVPETKIVGSPDKGKAGPPVVSPERQELANYEGQGHEAIKALDAKEKSIQTQMDILSSGQQTADQMRQASNLQQQAQQLQIDMTARHMQQAAEERDRQLEQQHADLRAQHVDPNRWFKSKGTAGSILAAIAIGAGAFAAAMPHTANHQNQALDIINGAVEKDIDAQKGAIEQSWKDLNWKGNKNDQQYVRDQYVLNKMNEAKLGALSNANAMIEERLRSTNNASAIAGMQGLKTQVQLERSKTIVDMGQHRLQVALKEQAQRAAAANANPLSPTNLRKGYDKLVDDIRKANAVKKPGDETPIPSFGDYAAQRVTGAGVAGGKGNNPGDKKAEQADKSAAYLESSGSNRVGENYYNKYYEPEGILASGNRAQRFAAWNSRMTADIHSTSVGLRSPELVKEITGPFKISPWMTEDQIRQRVKGAAEYIREHPEDEIETTESQNQDKDK